MSTKTARRARDPLHIPWAFSLAGAPSLPLTGDAHPLRREAAKWLLWGCGVALGAGVLAFGIWLWWTSREPPPPAMREIRIVRYTELGVPPSIARPSVPQINVAEAVAQIAPPSIGVPEPVPDEQATTQTIATTQQMAEALEPITMSDLGTGTGDSLVVDIDVDTDRSPEPEDFVPVDEEPVRLSIDPPVYPDMARSAGVEGTVLVRVLVGRDGKVRSAIVVDGPQMLHEPAAACAKTAIFRPALQNNKPVEVWVIIPVVFQLRGGR